MTTDEHYKIVNILTNIPLLVYNNSYVSIKEIVLDNIYNISSTDYNLCYFRNIDLNCIHVSFGIQGKELRKRLNSSMFSLYKGEIISTFDFDILLYCLDGDHNITYVDLNRYVKNIQRNFKINKL